MDVLAFRQIDGTIKLQGNIESPAGLYTSYKIYRKEIKYPTDSDGYLITTDSLIAGDNDLDYHDTLNIKDGTVYYYSIYREIGNFTWISRTSPADNFWYGVTYGNGLFVAIAGSGVGNRVMTSPDGITWTIRVSAADNNWYGVAYGDGLFVAVSYNGVGNRVMTSPDGITWTIRVSAADNNWSDVTYGNGLFVAVATTGVGNRVMTSPDGITWTIRASAADNSWSDVVYGDGLFVAVAYSGFGNRVMTSPDGITWTIRVSAANNKWSDVVYGDGLFVAVAYSGIGNRVMTSPDGITWTIRNSAANNSWMAVTYGDGIFVAVSTDGVGNNVMTSLDGITWTIRNSAADNWWVSVTYGDGIFVATSSNGVGNRVMTSSDGVESFYLRDYCMGTVPDFTEPLRAIVDGYFSNNLSITSNTNVRLFIDGMMEPIAGEMEALVRCMPKMLDLWKTDPTIFANILKAFNWKPAPLLNLKENKEIASQLMSYYFLNKGQKEVLETLYELENLTPVRIWEWHKNVYEQFINQDGQENYVEEIIGTGVGPFALSFDFDILPYTVEMKYFDASGNLIIVTDTPVSTVLGNLYESGVVLSVGTVSYEAKTMTFTPSTAPGLGQQIWVFFKYDMIAVDYEDDVTITRRGYHGDRMLYAVAPTRRGDFSGLGAWIYFYLHMELGREVYFSDATTHSYTFEDEEEDSYEFTYMTNLKFKSDRIQPVFGQQRFVFVDRIVVVVNVEDYIGNLPLEQTHLGMW